MSVDFNFYNNVPLIHIGYPKCLSKWLQKNLFIPDMGFIKCLNPDSVQEILVSKRPFCFDEQAIQGKVNFSIARAQKALPHAQAEKLVPVITSEALVGNMFCGGFDAELLAVRLAQAMPQAKILIVLREQRKMIRSLFSTAVAWGVPHKIGDFISPRNEHIAPQFNCEFLHYDALVAHYQRVFSKERVLVLPYELFSTDPVKFVDEIVQLYPDVLNSGMFSKLPFSVPVNKGQTAIETSIQRLFNRWILQTPFNYGGWVSDRETWTEARNAWRAPFSGDGFLLQKLERRLEEKIENLTIGKFSESNKRLSQLVGIDFSSFGYEC